MPIRIFVILAILATGLIAIKVLAISTEVFALLDPAQPAWANAKAKSTQTPAHEDAGHGPKMPDITSDPETETPVCKTSGFAEQAGLSEQELRVVMRLSERREELDVREQELKTREAVVALSEVKLDDRLARIELAIAKYDERIGLLDEQEAARMGQVVKTYETMKPKSAAIIFNTLDEKVLLMVATRMKPQSMAKILAAMTPLNATKLTVQMAEQFSRPNSAEALLADTDTKTDG